MGTTDAILNAGDRVTFTDDLYVTECCNCSITFGIPVQLQQRARENPNIWWYCPNGHHQHYPGKTEAAKVQEQLDREKRRNANLTSRLDQTQAERDHQAAVARGYKGALAKTKKRIGRGVCPCCNRHFADVERHMATKHPEQVA